jgi:hypothetical protein
MKRERVTLYNLSCIKADIDRMKGGVPEADLAITWAETQGYALDSLVKNDVGGVLILMSNTCGIDFIWDNLFLLKEDGLLEKAFVFAWDGSRVNWCHVPQWMLNFTVSQCSRDRLRSLGDPIPDGETFTLFRGISGNGPARRKRGLSWTGDFEKAKWFAVRFPHLAVPAVIQATIPRECVLFYTNSRQENEFICKVNPEVKLKTVWNRRDS